MTNKITDIDFHNITIKQVLIITYYCNYAQIYFIYFYFFSLSISASDSFYDFGAIENFMYVCMYVCYFTWKGKYRISLTLAAINSVLDDLNSFIRNRVTAKSNDFRCLFSNE